MKLSTFAGITCQLSPEFATNRGICLSLVFMVDNPEQADPPNPGLDLDVFSLKFG